MAITDFYDLINAEIFASVLGFGIFAWASGYALGYAMGFTRRMAHSVT